MWCGYANQLTVFRHRVVELLLTGIEITLERREQNVSCSRFEPDFENKILKAVWYKFRRNANLLTPEYRRLPIVHYYCYGGKVVDVTSKCQWLTDGITKMRDYL